MPLESATFIAGLVTSNPDGSVDTKSTLDDHLRLIKAVLRRTFPNIDGEISASAGVFNYLVGATSNLQTQISNLVNATATYALSAGFAANATNAVNATSAIFATSATNATNAVNATSATNATFANSASAATIASAVVTGGVSNAMLASMAQASVKGRATGAGTGAPVDLSPSQVLDIIATVDGAGSGLDADFLDGQSGSFYQSASNLNAGSIPDARVPSSAVTQHQTLLALTGNQIDYPIAIQSASFSVDSSMIAEYVICSSASTITITVGSNVFGGNGRSAIFIRRGAGAVNFSASGVTIRSPGGGVGISLQHGKVGLIQLASTEYELTGNIA